MPQPLPPATPDLGELTALFYDDPQQLGRFTEVAADEMPEGYRRLLAHESHMTVTVESHHGCPVDVRVLERTQADGRYARKILLARQTDGVVVQYGIMRIDLQCLEPHVRERIEGEGTPLGRVLIENNVLRTVRLASLWRIEPGAELQRLFGVSSNDVVYGRTAIIECNGEPAVELLEIVTPLLQ